MSRGTGRVGLRHAAQVLLHQLGRLLGVEVPDDHQRRVVRDVVGAEEITHVLDRRRLEILHAADGRVLVGMDRERLVVDDFVQPPVGLILDAHAPLFLDHFALGLEHLLVDAQRGQAIGFEPEHERQVLRRERLPEDRRVFVRIGVALAADARDPRRMPFRLDVLRALEHHVLEEVRESGTARLLVLRADVVPDLSVNDRRRMIFEEHDLETVRQRRHRVIQLRRPDCRVRERIDGKKDRSGDDDRDDSRAKGRGHEPRLWQKRPKVRPSRRLRLPAPQSAVRGQPRACGARAACGRPPTTSASRDWRWRDSRK